MADREPHKVEQPVAAPRNLTRVLIFVLAALVVIALIAWFLTGNPRGPGIAAEDNVQTATEQAFEDTVIVEPDGTARQQVTPGKTLNPEDNVMNAPPVVTEPPPAADTAQ